MATVGPGESESKIYDIQADEKACELDVEYSHESSAEERQELSGEAWKRELGGPEIAKELENTNYKAD